MNKQFIKDLSQEIVDKFELDKKQANSFVEKMFSVLQEGLQDEKIVKIKGLGTFKVISVQSRKSIDVNTGEPILIDGRDKISFTPDSDMRDFVNRPFSQFETVAVNDGTDFSLIDKKFEEEEKEETSEDAVEDKQEKSTANQQEDSIANQQEDSVEDQQQKDSVEDKQEETLAQEAPSTIEIANNQESEEPKDEEEAKQEMLTQEPNTPEQTSEGNGLKAEDIGQETKDTKSEIQAVGIEEEVHEATVNSSRKFEDENHQLQVANEELRNNFRHQYRMMKGVISVFVVVVLLCLGGGYSLLNQLKKRDHRIEMLEILAYRNKNGINAHPATTLRSMQYHQQQANRTKASRLTRPWLKTILREKQRLRVNVQPTIALHCPQAL